MIAGTLEIQMLANMARLADDMKAAKHSVESAMSGIEKAVDSAKAALGALGIGLGIHYFTGLVQSSIDAVDKLQHMSRATGIMASDLAGLRLLAAESGTDMDSLAKGIERMSVSIGKDPGKFEALGVTAKDNVGAFKQLADIFISLPDIQQRNALAQSVFNRSWYELAPALSLGGEKIAEVIERGTKLSQVTEEMAHQAHEFHVQQAELNTQIAGLRTKIVGDALPGLNEIVAAMREAATEGGALLTVWVGLGGAAAFLFGLTDAQQKRDRLKEINEQLAIARKQLEAGSLNPEKKSFWSFLIPDVKLNEQALASVRATVAALEKEKEKLMPKDEKPKPLGPSKAEMDAAAARAAAFLRDTYNARVAEIRVFGQMYANEIRTANTLAALAIEEGGVRNLRTQLELLNIESQNNASLIRHQIQDQEKLRAIASSGSQTPEKIKDAAQANAKVKELNQELVDNEKITQGRIGALRTSTFQQSQDQYNSWLQSQQSLGELLVRSYDNQYEAEELAYKKRKDALDVFLKAETDEVVGAQRFREMLALEHEANLSNSNSSGIKSRFELAKMTDDQRLQYYTGTLANITAQGAQHNKKLFELNKIASIANAAVSMYEGASAALKWGWPLGPIFAGLIIASGVANIAAIAKTKFGDTSAGSGGGSVGTGGSAVSSIGSTSAVSSVPTTPTPAGVTIVVQGNLIGNEDFVHQTLVPALRDAINNRDVTIIDPSSRQAANLVTTQ